MKGKTKMKITKVRTQLGEQHMPVSVELETLGTGSCFSDG